MPSPPPGSREEGEERKKALGTGRVQYREIGKGMQGSRQLSVVSRQQEREKRKDSGLSKRKDPTCKTGMWGTRPTAMCREQTERADGPIDRERREIEPRSLRCANRRAETARKKKPVRSGRDDKRGITTEDTEKKW